jgi:hypothetical protein
MAPQPESTLSIFRMIAVCLQSVSNAYNALATKESVPALCKLLSMRLRGFSSSTATKRRQTSISWLRAHAPAGPVFIAFNRKDVQREPKLFAIALRTQVRNETGAPLSNLT